MVTQVLEKHVSRGQPRTSPRVGVPASPNFGDPIYAHTPIKHRATKFGLVTRGKERICRVSHAPDSVRQRATKFGMV